MEPNQPQQVPVQAPASEPQVIIAQPSTVQSSVASIPYSSGMPGTGSKRNFLLPIILVIVLLVLGGVVFLFKDQILKPSASGAQTSQQTQQLPQDVNCTTGFEGNTGNNFCSNYHGGSSQCKPGMPDDYPDGCTR